MLLQIVLIVVIRIHAIEMLLSKLHLLLVLNFIVSDIGTRVLSEMVLILLFHALLRCSPVLYKIACRNISLSLNIQVLVAFEVVSKIVGLNKLMAFFVSAVVLFDSV